MRRFVPCKPGQDSVGTELRNLRGIARLVEEA